MAGLDFESESVSRDPNLTWSPTRYSPIFAPNGMVIAGSALPAQAGIDVLQNGGSAVDGAVAALATLLNSEFRPEPGTLLAIIWAGANQPVLGLAHRCEGADEVVAQLHVIVGRFGVRSLYDLLRPASVLVEGSGQETEARIWKRAMGSDSAIPSQLDARPATLTPLERVTMGDLAFLTSPGDRVQEPALEPVSGGEIPEAILTSLLRKHAGRSSDRPTVFGTNRIAQAAAVDHRGMVSSLAWVPLTVAANGCHVLVLERDRPKLVAGASLAAPSVVTQVALGRLFRGMSLQAAVEFARVSLGDTGVSVERGLPSPLAEGWRAHGIPIENVPRWNGVVGAVQAVEVDRTHGLLIGCADPRGTGSAAGY